MTAAFPRSRTKAHRAVFFWMLLAMVMVLVVEALGGVIQEASGRLSAWVERRTDLAGSWAGRSATAHVVQQRLFLDVELVEPGRPSALIRRFRLIPSGSPLWLWRPRAYVGMDGSRIRATLTGGQLSLVLPHQTIALHRP